MTLFARGPFIYAIVFAFAVLGCSSGGSSPAPASSPTPASTPAPTPTATPTGTPTPTTTPTATPTAPPTPSPSPTATPTATPGPAVQPAAVAFRAIGLEQSVTVSEPGYAGTFTISAPSCSRVASIAASGFNTYAITSINAGSCVAAFVDSRGAVGELPIGVTVTNVGGS